MSKFLLACILVAATLMSCQKDKEESEPPFNPVGYWVGNASPGNCSVLNYGNGKARFYYLVRGFDTAGAALKSDGVYEIRNGLYFGRFHKAVNNDSIFVEIFNASSATMKGRLVVASEVVAPTIELWKQR